MKETAMQTLISKLQTEISELNKKIDKYSNDTGVYTGHKYGLDQALSVAESLLDMEKNQMGYPEKVVRIGFSLGMDYYCNPNSWDKVSSRQKLENLLNEPKTFIDNYTQNL
jgi:hypothetical protein